MRADSDHKQKRKKIGNGKYRIRIKRSIKAKTVSERVLYLLRTIENGVGEWEEGKKQKMTSEK